MIHSFWVPNLHGKTDLIPGHTTAVWLQADQPRHVSRPVRRVLRPPAREHGASIVVAEPDEDFESWLAAHAAAGTRTAD